jgi:hypothetical protein
MQAHIRRWLTAFALVQAGWLALPGPAEAQLEPEAYTILKVALKERPPNPAELARAVKSCRNDSDRRKLLAVWLKAWALKPSPRLFDALDGCFDPGPRAKGPAEAFVKGLAPRLPEKDVARSATLFLDRLHALPAADRERLHDFVRFAKRRPQGAP